MTYILLEYVVLSVLLIYPITTSHIESLSPDNICCQDTLSYQDYHGPVNVEGYIRIIHFEYEESEWGPAGACDYVQFIVTKGVPDKMRIWMINYSDKHWLNNETIGIGSLSIDKASIMFTNIMPDTGYVTGRISGDYFNIIMSSSVDTLVILDLWKIPDPEPQDVPLSFSFFKLIKARKKQTTTGTTTPAGARPRTPTAVSAAPPTGTRGRRSTT